MLYNKQYIQSLGLVRKTLVTIAICAFVGQMLLDISLENILSNLLALGAFVTACLVVFSYRNVSVGSALSATVVFLMISANSLAPMIGTLLEGNPITETLTVPVTVFTHRLIFAVCLLFAHYLAASSSSLAIRVAISQISRRLKIKVLIPPESLWVIGAIGLFAILLKFFHPPVVVSKILDGFAYLMPAPFLLMLPPYYSKARIKKEKVRLILYYLLQVVFSLVYNTRMAMVLPIGIVASGWLLTLLTGQTIVNQKTIQTGIIRGIVGLFLIGQFADFSTAILIERAQRDNRSGSSYPQHSTVFWIKKRWQTTMMSNWSYLRVFWPNRNGRRIM